MRLPSESYASETVLDQWGQKDNKNLVFVSKRYNAEETM